MCLQRKIKCDESAPECSQCRISGVKCSGPRQGALFVDMSAQIRQKSEERRAIAEQKEPRLGIPCSSTHATSHYKAIETDLPFVSTEARRKPTPRGISVEKGRSSRARTNRAIKLKGQESALLHQSTSHERQFQLPTTYQPDRSHQFELLFLSNFVASSSLSERSGAGLHTWTRELLDLLSSTEELSVSYSIRATSMAMYGRMAGSEDIEIEAIKWYARGLEAQRQSLQLAAKAPSRVILTDEAVCTSIMLSLFETMISTTPTGWLRHYDGAAKMLEMMGPERCQSQFTNKLFRTTRLATVLIGMTLDVPCVFASEVWTTIPFALHPKAPIDKLVDILLQLPGCTPLFNNITKPHDQASLALESAKVDLFNRAEPILLQLDDFWTEHKSDVDPDYDRRVHFNSSQGEEDFSSTEGILILPRGVPFRDTFAATFTALYDSANIIALIYASVASSTPEKYKQRILLHATSILASVAYHEAQGPSSGGSFAMIFPVKIVYFMSPSEVQRDSAREALFRWGANRGLNDLCTVCAPEIVRSVANRQSV